MILKFGETKGVNIGRLMEAQSFDPSLMKRPEAWIPARRFIPLWTELANQSADPDFGLHLGEWLLDNMAGHIFFSVMMNSSTVKKAIDVICHYHGLMNNASQPKVVHESTRSRIFLESGRSGVVPHRHQAEFVLSLFVSILRRLTLKNLKLERVRFQHVRPPDTSEHQRIFDCPLLFDQEVTELVVGKEVMGCAVFLASDEFFNRLEPYLSRLLERQTSYLAWSNRTMSHLYRVLMRGEKARLERVAADLAVSPRRLQYRLRDENTTFNRLLEQARKETAIHYLEQTEVPISDIAFILGFSEQSGFNHAFRRWTGMSPKVYRQQHMATCPLPSSRP